MLLVVSFATLGLLLAALGIYGVISYSVTRQTQEIGIRMALGANAGIVRRHVLAGTIRLALIGIVVGAAASLAGARLIASLLFDTSPWDVATYWGCRPRCSPSLLFRAIFLHSGHRASTRRWLCAPIRACCIHVFVLLAAGGAVREGAERLCTNLDPSPSISCWFAVRIERRLSEGANMSPIRITREVHQGWLSGNGIMQVQG